MSERRSWDVQRKPAARTAPVEVPVRKAKPPVEPVRRQQAQKPVVRTQAPRRAAPTPAGTLKERRKKKRQVARYVALAVLVAAFAAIMYALWLPALRIQSVSAHGPAADAAASVARSRLTGTYLYLVPRNSIFFFPKQKIRSAILDATPSVSAVSITRTTFSSIEVGTTPRAASFLWCGTSIDTPYPGGVCFDADIEGLIFSQDMDSSSTTASTSQHVNGVVRVFSALDRDIENGKSPVRAHLASPERIPNALRFVDAIRQLGAPVSALAIRGDEGDLWLNGPTRITYVLGREKEAADLAASALPTLSLTNGTIKYIDLRFSGKAYVMRYGDTAE